MSDRAELTPMRPREFFGRPWSGHGDWIPGRWLSRLRPPARLRFRSFTTPLTDTAWLVHDTTTWEDGRVERRDLLAVLVARDRVRLTGAEMPGGSEIELRQDGFAFAPYLMSVALPFLPFPVLARCHDRCRLEPGGVLVDTIEISFLGVPVGHQAMRLRPEKPDSELS